MLFSTKRLCQLGLLALFSMIMGGCSTTQYDCTTKNASLIIVGENAEPGSVAVQGQIFDRLGAGLAANLTGKGYNVRGSQQLYAAYPEYFNRDEIEHNDDSLVDLVRSLKGAPVDVIAVMSVAASTQEEDYHTRVNTAIGVRLIDLQSAKSLGKFVIDSDASTSVRPGCKGDCLRQAIVDSAKPVTLEVATIISEKLACAGSGKNSGGFDNSHGGFSAAYAVIVEGFTTEEMMKIESYLKGFSGYESHRVIYSGARRTEWWYETSSKSAALNRNLHTALQRLNLRAVVQFSGNTYIVKKITLRGGSVSPTESKGEDW